jgi:hypothetical protein
MTINVCASNPCHNNGLCTPTQYKTSFTCSCYQGWTGERCEHAENMNPCASLPCLNLGLCTPNSAGYFCSCLSGWTGLNCEICKFVSFLGMKTFNLLLLDNLFLIKIKIKILVYRILVAIMVFVSHPIIVIVVHVLLVLVVFFVN